MKLNEIQKNIINTNEKNILILAGAGSGKTTTLKYKILDIIEKEKDINKSKILCITFTKKAAFELKERINNKDVEIYTFHGFCYNFLKNTVLKDKKMALNLEKNFSKRNLLKISLIKNSFKKNNKKIYKKYQDFLLKNNLIDFDDLLILFLKNINLFNTNYKYILIDEFQDTNLVQYEIIKKISKEYTNIIAVGDFDQSIYKFRGANNQIIEKYIKEFKAKTFILNYNYRSDEKIVELSNLLIEKNIFRVKKELLSTIKNNSEIKYLYFNNYQEIYEDLINKIESLRNKKINYNDMAILSRNNKELLYLKNYFNQRLLFYDTKPKILTIHQSKGLEFEYVFIIGLEDGTFPSTINNQYLDMEEERRLFYVSITRAKKKLFLYSSLYGLDGYFKKPSSFLKDIGF